MELTEAIDLLWHFHGHCNELDMIEIFGDRGKHYWDKFQSFNGDTVKFYRYLDDDQKGKLLEALKNNTVKKKI